MPSPHAGEGATSLSPPLLQQRVENEQSFLPGRRDRIASGIEAVLAAASCAEPGAGGILRELCSRRPAQRGPGGGSSGPARPQPESAERSQERAENQLKRNSAHSRASVMRESNAGSPPSRGRADALKSIKVKQALKLPTDPNTARRHGDIVSANVSMPLPSAIYAASSRP